MIRNLISIIVLVCFVFQFCFVGNGYAVGSGDSQEAESDVASGKENSKNKIKLTDDDYYKLLLNYPNPVTSINASNSYLNVSRYNTYQEFSLHPDLKIGKRIKVTLKDGTVRRGEFQEVTNESIHIRSRRSGLHQMIQVRDISQIKFRKDGINGTTGAVIGLGIGSAVVGILISDSGDLNTRGKILFTLIGAGIGAGIGAAEGAKGDGGDAVTIVPDLE